MRPIGKPVRFNDSDDRDLAPRGTDRASVIESGVPIPARRTRPDLRQTENARLTPIAFNEA